jgi:hypothetical protein
LRQNLYVLKNEMISLDVWPRRAEKATNTFLLVEKLTEIRHKSSFPLTLHT